MKEKNKEKKTFKSEYFSRHSLSLSLPLLSTPLDPLCVFVVVICFLFCFVEGKKKEKKGV